MTEQLPSQYQPGKIEPQVYQDWLDGNYFHAEPDGRDKRYCIVIPPPNVTGVLHMGHALNNTLQDILIRFKRMAGYNTLWMPGTDHAGIATQSVVEKQVLAQEGKTRGDLGREELVKRIWAWKDQCGNRILDQLRAMGCSCDWERTRFTLDEICAKAVRQTFIGMFKAGFIYRGKRLVNWDPVTQTALADDELEYETVDTFFWYIRYPLADQSGYITVATTRPETMLGDTAVAINPNDPRAKQLAGKKVILPLMNRQIPIIADNVVTPADPDSDDEKARYSTGFLKVTPAHDPIDYDIGLRHNLPLINVMNPDATINENGGKYHRMDRFEARKEVEKDLEQLGLLEKKRPYRHQIGHSYRSHVPVEPYLSDQWFIKTDQLAADAAQVVRDGRIKFFPQRYTNTYLDWMDNLHDWCISRQLWWGHRIPIWYCNNRDCYQADQYQHCQAGSSEAERKERRFFFVCQHADGQDPKVCPKCGQSDIQQDKDVLDTWFSSALWPHSTMGWPEDSAELKCWYPTSVLITSRDIITLWVARMVMTGLFNVNNVPFDHVYIHSKILDGKGETMSKSKGNGVDPLDIIEKYGADAMRFSLAYLTTETQDIRMPVTKETLPCGKQINTSDRFEVGRNFCNKLWNASRFALMNLTGQAPEALEFDTLALEDRWILSRLQGCIQQFSDHLENYRYSDAAQAVYRFFWNEFCDWYLELIKPRLTAGGQAGDQARQVLSWCLDQALRLLHPIIPFVTETIWTRLNQGQAIRGIQAPAEHKTALVVAPWPQARTDWQDRAAEQQMQDLQELIRAIRDIRAKINRIRAANKQPSVAKLPQALVRTDQDRGKLFERYKPLICRLAGTDNLQISQQGPVPPGSASQILAQMQIFAPLADLIDAKQERDRLDKQLAELDQHIGRSRARLENPQFTDKAPPQVVQQHRQKLQDLQTRRAGIEQSLAELPEN